MDSGVFDQARCPLTYHPSHGPPHCDPVQRTEREPQLACLGRMNDTSRQTPQAEEGQSAARRSRRNRPRPDRRGHHRQRLPGREQRQPGTSEVRHVRRRTEGLPAQGASGFEEFARPAGHLHGRHSGREQRPGAHQPHDARRGRVRPHRDRGTARRPEGHPRVLLGRRRLDQSALAAAVRDHLRRRGRGRPLGRQPGDPLRLDAQRRQTGRARGLPGSRAGRRHRRERPAAT